jgi:hypothetical protein
MKYCLTSKVQKKRNLWTLIQSFGVKFGISKNTNKQKTRKKNVYDGDRKSRFIDRKTTGDKLHETGSQTRKLRNGEIRIIILSCSLPQKKDELALVFWQFSSFHLQVEPTFSSWMACLHV